MKCVICNSESIKKLCDNCSTNYDNYDEEAQRGKKKRRGWDLARKKSRRNKREWQ